MDPDRRVHCPNMAQSAAVRVPGVPAPPVSLSAPARGTAVTLDMVYRDHFAFVWRNARRLGVQGATVDDVVQDVFLVVHRKLHEFEGRGSLRSWLYSITVRVIRDHLKSHRRRRTDSGRGEDAEELDSIADYTRPSPVDWVETANKARLLQHLLGQLNEEKREVLVLAELEQMTAPEISEALGIPLNTAYSRLRSARQDFEQVLARHRARTDRRPT